MVRFADLVRPRLRGIDVYAAPDARRGLRLDANESPYDLPPGVRRALADRLVGGMGLNEYPDDGCAALREAICERHRAEGVDLTPGMVVVGCGSDQLIAMACSLLLDHGDKALCPSPSFEMYGQGVLMAGGDPRWWHLDARDGYRYDVGGMADAVRAESIKLAFICSPNNPTGNSAACDDIGRLAAACPETVIVVDEAYAEFADESFIGRVNGYGNAVVLRTLSKAYGMAGLRVGYSVSGEEAADALRKAKPVYNVPSFSQAAAVEMLRDVGSVMGRVTEVRRERAALAGKVGALALGRLGLGAVVYPSQANFILVRLPGGAAAKTAAALADAGIYVRAFREGGPVGDCLRITVGDPAANDAVVKALGRIWG